MTPGTDQIAAALARASVHFRPLKKNHTADAGAYSYQYADLADLGLATVHALAAEELTAVEVCDVLADGTKVCKARLLHASGQELTSVWPITGGESSQDFGAEFSFVRRYLRMGLLGIAAESREPHTSGDVTTSPADLPAYDVRDAPPRQNPRKITEKQIARLVLKKHAAAKRCEVDLEEIHSLVLPRLQGLGFRSSEELTARPYDDICRYVDALAPGDFRRGHLPPETLVERGGGDRA